MLILYSTLGCHLCKQAQAIIYLCLEPDIDLTVVDIADDEQLMEMYGVRIPVVKKQNSDRELEWPFDEQQFRSWYQAQGRDDIGRKT